MSFRGYWQCMCANGHAWRMGTLDDQGECEYCEQKPAWTNLVDITNEDESNHVELECIVQAQYKKCNLGHEHLISPAQYTLPYSYFEKQFEQYRHPNDLKPTAIKEYVYVYTLSSQSKVIGVFATFELAARWYLRNVHDKTESFCISRRTLNSDAEEAIEL